MKIETETMVGCTANTFRGIGYASNTKEPMSLKEHRRLTDLAHCTKAFIDINGGVVGNECFFGEIMTKIIHLK